MMIEKIGESATLERLRRECPEWLLPDGMTADFVIMTLDKNIK